MNDGVGKELSSVSYISVDDVAAHNYTEAGQRNPLSQN